MITKYIKPYAGQIAIVILLILIQAFCELNLPDYMSQIVNTGIGQSGIHVAAPEIIRAEELHRLFPAGSPIYDYYELHDGLYRTAGSSDTLMEEAAAIFITAFEDGGASAEARAINYIIEEYTALGMDLTKMQNSYIFATGGKMILLALLGVVAAICAGFMNARVSAGFARDVRKAVFAKTVGFSNKEFDTFSTASLITRSTNDIQQLQGAMTMGLRIVIFAPFMGVGAIIKVLETQSEMSWILAVSVVSVLVIVIFLFAFTTPKFKLIQKITDRLNLVTREALTGMMVIRAFSTEAKEEERFEETNQSLAKMNRFVSRSMGTMMPLMTLIMNFTTIAVIFIGARYVAAGFIQVGSIMAFIQYAMHVIMSFLFVSMISIMMPRAMVSASRVNEVLKSETNIRDAENTLPFPEDGAGHLVFSNVSFKYPDADEYVLKDISFTANPGETTAFIGSTGSGKSTLINLIPRFYDATEGTIEIDGVDIKKAALKDLRHKISYAPQKGLLFSGTIASNIKYADPDAISQADMENAARTAQAMDFISEKEAQFDDPIAQGGGNVSGGQRQRLSIARALAKKSQFLIFDDSFSALDYKTDAMLRKELAQNFKDRTILIVAQRIATIRNAEKIIVLDEGGIAGMGNHEELMESCEVYRQIASSQLS